METINDWELDDWMDLRTPSGLSGEGSQTLVSARVKFSRYGKIKLIYRGTGRIYTSGFKGSIERLTNRELDDARELMCCIYFAVFSEVAPPNR